MRQDYFKAYCRNLQRLAMVELVDEQRRRSERRGWRASLVDAAPGRIGPVRDTPCAVATVG